jgi:nucleotide-binding universal stress UspA family protein
VIKITVGTDGSANAATALRWAAEEADRHRAELEVVAAAGCEHQRPGVGAERSEPDDRRDGARAALATWVDEALGQGAAVRQRVVRDTPVRALLDVGDDADLLVVGARGTGGIEGLLLGSVGERLVRLATRPVAVVRAAAPVAGGRDVVGVDGSTRSLRALRWGAAEARTRHADLHVVHAWRLPAIAAPPGMTVLPDWVALAASGGAILDAALDDPALAGVRAHRYAINGPAAPALLERAAGAGLVVAGTRGLGRVTAAFLGSVTRQLLHHAPCPVVVI